MKTRDKEKGFTLIEIIVVLAILGILAGVAMMQFVNLSTSARDAALEGVFGTHGSQLALAVAVCKGLPQRANGAGDCNPPALDFSGDFRRTVYDKVSVTGQEIQRSPWNAPSGTFKLCSGSRGNGRYIVVTYDETATPSLVRSAPADWIAGGSCSAAS